MGTPQENTAVDALVNLSESQTSDSLGATDDTMDFESYCKHHQLSESLKSRAC